MGLKQAHDEIHALARQTLTLPNGEVFAEQLFEASMTLYGAENTAAYGEDDEYAKENAAAEAYLAENLTAFKKGGGFWSPPHNLGLNRALMGWNLWSFTILPLFPKKQAYSSGQSHRPEGLVISPIWRPAMQDQLFRHLDMGLAKKLVGAAKQARTVQDMVRKEIAWVEQQFGVTVPSDIKAKVNKDALKSADRRWNVNRLRVKKRLLPFDGSKPIDFT